MTGTRILTPKEREVIKKYLSDKPLDEKEQTVLKLTKHDIKTNWKTINDDYLLIVKLDISTFKQQRTEDRAKQGLYEVKTFMPSLGAGDTLSFKAEKAKKK